EAERARTQNRAVLDAAGEAMLLVSPDQQVLSVNRRFSEMFGIPANEVLDREFSTLQPFAEGVLADPPYFLDRLSSTAADAEKESADIVEQGWAAQREVELSSRPVRTAQGAHLGRLYVCRDVTRERQLDRLKTEFLFLVSHELRTPLTAIKGFVDLLLDG